MVARRERRRISFERQLHEADREARGVVFATTDDDRGSARVELRRWQNHQRGWRGGQDESGEDATRGAAKISMEGEAASAGLRMVV